MGNWRSEWGSQKLFKCQARCTLQQKLSSVGAPLPLAAIAIDNLAGTLAAAQLATPFCAARAKGRYGHLVYGQNELRVFCSHLKAVIKTNFICFSFRRPSCCCRFPAATFHLPLLVTVGLLTGDLIWTMQRPYVNFSHALLALSCAPSNENK